MDFFAFIENTYTKRKRVTSSENQLDEGESYYMVTRWLSMHPLSFTGAYKAARRSRTIPQWAIGCLLYNTVKQQKKPPALSYIRKDKKEKDKVLLEKLSSLFHCSEKHAEEIAVIFERNNTNIRKAFGLTGKE
jgi:hypothetical protein